MNSGTVMATRMLCSPRKNSEEKAVDLDGTFLEGNRVRVERCSLLDFEQAIDSFVPQDNRRKGIEKVEKQFHGQVENQPDIIPHSPRSSERSRKEFFETCCVMLRNLPSKVERLRGSSVLQVFKHHSEWCVYPF